MTLATIANTAFAQFSEFEGNGNSPYTIVGENNTLQIGGRTSAYYEYRALKSGEDNKDHNGWGLKDMDLDVLGKTKSKFVYEFHMSIVDLATAAATQNTANSANPGIKAAYLAYNGWPVHIKLGYDKLPYSQGSIIDVYATPFWSHANLYGGDLFSRRDFGLTLSGTINNHIVLYGGGYSGMGENYFEYGTDRSGTMEYVGRVEYVSANMKYRAIDEEGSPIPIYRIGLNARYMDKTQPAGKTQTYGGSDPTADGFAANYGDAQGIYGMRIFDGKRTIYGGDFIVKYKGFSLVFEEDLIKMQPTSPLDPLYQGTSESVNGGVINAGGFCASAHYNCEPIKSAFSVQYENVNVNDLAPGHQEWLFIGYAYKVSRFNSVFKAEYSYPMVEDQASNPLKYTGQIRVGYQIVF